MLRFLRNEQRRHLQNGNQEIWRSFFEDGSSGQPASTFGFLVAFDEERLPPGNSTGPHFDNESEVLTYIYRGSLSQEDTTGKSDLIHTGEFQCMSTGSHIRHKETSVALSDWMHMFRMSLQPYKPGIEADQEQKRFTAAQRHNELCVVASPDRRKGSLLIHQDVQVYSAILDQGHHMVHELSTGRSVWLHIVCGEVVLNDDTVLTQGDGVGVTDEASVSLTVQENAEILLVDLGPANLPPWEKTL